jgi:hypothetical protein
MSTLVKGPFELEYNSTILSGIEAVGFTYSVKSTEFESVQGQTYTAFGAHKAEAEITLLETDVASIAAVLPQYHVANGATLSSGEVVSSPAGAIDLVPGGCDATAPTASLIITSCGNPGQVLRMLNASAEISGVEIDSTVRKVKVKFTGQPVGGEATIQFFAEGAVAGIS